METLTTGKPVPKFEKEEYTKQDSKLWKTFVFLRFYFIIFGLVGGLLGRMSYTVKLRHFHINIMDYPITLVALAFFSLMSSWSFYRCAVDDAGQVLPHHFRD
jgi:hypothetical protein